MYIPVSSLIRLQRHAVHGYTLDINPNIDYLSAWTFIVKIEANFERGETDGSEIKNKLSRQDSVPSIGLNPKIVIAAGEFEKNWIDLPIL